MKRIIAITCFFLLLVSKVCIAQYKITSPDKQTAAEFKVNANGQLQYLVRFAGKEIITWSSLGIVVNNVPLGSNASITSKASLSHNEKMAWSLGEADTISNHYNQLTIACKSAGKSFEVIARVFNGSVAIRYKVPGQIKTQNLVVTQELTTFNFLEALTIYQYNQESVFTPVSIDTFSKRCDLPATLTGKNGYVSVGEADNHNFTKAELVRGPMEHSLAIVFPRDATVQFDSAFQTPWRTISLSKTAIGLHQFSQLNFKLTPPPAGGIPAWIKPGKLIRAQLNTQSGLDCIDFAANHDFQYIMFDAGWYGAEFRTTSDPTQVIPAIDLQKVIDYGKEKKIGVILYVNYVGLRQYLDTILPLYKQRGIAGFKFGFVDGLTQQGLSWLSAALKKVQDAGFVLNIHDNYKPTGLSHSYPALLTQEGIRGDENSPDAFHTTTLPFTRYLAGPADFTYCYPNEKNRYSKNIKVSMAQQLALTVIYFSPLQAMFWYGQPKDYNNEQEIEFFKYVPTVWNETHYLAGEIGKNISVARRKGDTWFIGSAAGFEDWRESLLLDFLAKGKTYTATVYEDGDGTIRKRTVNVKKGDLFPVNLKAKGGQAIIIRAVTK